MAMGVPVKALALASRLLESTAWKFTTQLTKPSQAYISGVVADSPDVDITITWTASVGVDRSGFGDVRCQITEVRGTVDYTDESGKRATRRIDYPSAPDVDVESAGVTPADLADYAQVWTVATEVDYSNIARDYLQLTRVEVELDVNRLLAYIQ